MKRWKPILGSLVIFLLGLIAGGVVTLRLVDRRVESGLLGGPAALEQMAIQRLGRRLDLDPRQKSALADILSDSRKRIQAARAPLNPAVRDILRDTEQRIRAELNPEQQTKFDVWVRARRDNWNQ